MHIELFQNYVNHYPARSRAVKKKKKNWQVMQTLNNITYANYLFTKVKVTMTTLFVLKFMQDTY